MFRKHGEPWFSRTLVIGDPQENVERPGVVYFFRFLFGFSSRGFWKIIRAGLPHFFGPVKSSGDPNSTDFVLLFRFVQLFDPKKYENPTVSLYF